MASYGQFCAIARAHEAVGGRWTLLIVRELLMGGRRFNDIRRGIPRISRTVLSERIDALIEVGAVRRVAGRRGPEYELTPAGEELRAVLSPLAQWGQRWLPRQADQEDVDAGPLLVDIGRRMNLETLPQEPLVIRFELQEPRRLEYLLLRRGEVSLCSVNPGFPEPVRVSGPVAALLSWWRGDVSFIDAQRKGLRIEGPRPLVRAFPSWFKRYLYAEVESAA